MKKYVCENRNEFIRMMEEEIIKNPSNFYYFLGKSGTGKKYVLEQIENRIRKKFKIYRITSDIFIEKNKNVLTHNLDVSFSLNSFIGISLTPSKNDKTKINYIISNLKSLTLKKNIIVSAIDYDGMSSESRDFISTLINNKKTIEKMVKKKITVIITCNYNYFNWNGEGLKVVFKDYTRADLYNYLTAILKYMPTKITNHKLNQIYKLCGTNFNLVNCYSDFILEDNVDTSIEAIVDKKLNYYISSGCKYNLSKENLENILYTSSLSIDTLTPKMISYINRDNISDVEIGFQCAVDEYFLNLKYRDAFSDYIFISEKEKDYLGKYEVSNRSDKFIQYYVYLSDSMEDEYLERAQFLFKYYSEMNHKILSLLILELSKSYLLNDDIKRQKIEIFFINHNFNLELEAAFKKICLAYQKHYCEEYVQSSEILEDLDYSTFNIVLSAELRRLQFKNGQIGHILTRQKMTSLTLQMRAYLDKGLFLIKDIEFKPKEEKLLSLRIIFDIAPYILDSRNDKDVFEMLYDKSLLIVKYINDNFVKKSYSEYIINVFNRKAFLFAAPSVALLYYEEAESYFRDNRILDEYAVTLASKAGMNIALRDYKSAIENSQKAISIINENNMEIQQIEKIYNNLYIAEFLDFEQNSTSIRKLCGYAKLKIQDLEKLITDKACGKNHVILTNIASLYLYSNNTNQYIKTKKIIEKSLKCQDISDLQDTTVNDFYRYHFAWYEFYRHFRKGEWTNCTVILRALDGFYPAIFHNYKKMDLRVEAAGYLIEHKIKLTIIEFSFHFLDYAPSNTSDYCSRGLPLSDLQFTSWE